jgi:radical SAM superfamily enzyme YgiQ (UPF0313 family)
MRIYLADLLYDTVSINSAVPLSIGYIAAYLEQVYGDQLEIKLFKYPKKLESALHEAPPDVIGFANYTWNERLSLHFCKLAKRKKPEVVTVMGGPNIGTDPVEIQEFLLKNKLLDYYIVNSGEEPMANLVGNLLRKVGEIPAGCATLSGSDLIYTPVEWKSLAKEISYPSPYLTGWLDEFLLEPTFFPLIETNRGCPFQCVYCAWGAAALAKIQFRSLEEICKEIDYIVDHGAGQSTWFSCDANFGINQRDVEVAKKLRAAMEREGGPQNVVLFDSKNTSDRNIQIADILKNKGMTLIAIQSADQEVLKHSGRGSIKFSHIRKQIAFYHQKGNKVRTDLILGLPGESYASHLKTLADCYDMGFDHINAFNMLLLNGTAYASTKYRQDFGVVGKYRPFFGKYGIYGDEIVFELSESVRATKDICENDLNDIRIVHWLMFYAWDTHLFKPILKFAHKNYQINPAVVLTEVAQTTSPSLRKFFDEFKRESMSEWFDTAQEMTQFYSDRNNYDNLVSCFIKLNHKHYALAYQNFEITEAIVAEIVESIRLKAENMATFDYPIFNEVVELTRARVCKNLTDELSLVLNVRSGKAIQVLLDDDNGEYPDISSIEIYRPKEHIDTCKTFFENNDIATASAKNIIRFFDSGGLEMLVNSVRLVDSSLRREVCSSVLPVYSLKVV